MTEKKTTVFDNFAWKYTPYRTDAFHIMKSPVNFYFETKIQKKRREKYALFLHSSIWHKTSPYHWDNGAGNVREFDATLVQYSDQQLAIFPRVLMFNIVCLHNFFLENQHHLQTHKQPTDGHWNLIWHWICPFPIQEYSVFFLFNFYRNFCFGLVWFLFCGPSTHFRSFRAWSVNLATLFLGKPPRQFTST